MPKLSTNSRFSRWLMKSDMPHTIEYLESQPGQRMKWNGIRNLEARKILKEFMPLGSLAFFYMSGVTRPAIYGIIKIVKPAYPCELWVPSTPEEKNPWFQVDVELVRKLKRPIYLTELKSYMESSLNDMVLFRRQRLSISGVTEAHWDFIVDLENKEAPPEIKKSKSRKKPEAKDPAQVTEDSVEEEKPLKKVKSATKPGTEDSVKEEKPLKKVKSATKPGIEDSVEEEKPLKKVKSATKPASKTKQTDVDQTDKDESEIAEKAPEPKSKKSRQKS